MKSSLHNLHNNAGLWVWALVLPFLSQPHSFPQLSASVALVFALPLSLICPRLAAGLSLIAVWGIGDPWQPVLLALLMQIVLTAYVGEIMTAIVLSVGSACARIPDGIQVVILYVCLQEAFLFVGVWIHHLYQKQRETALSAERRHECLQDYLHRTAIADMTAVVAEAEVLRLQHPELSNEVNGIIEAGRSAISSLRNVIRGESVLSFDQLLAHACSSLRAAGFSVDVEVSTDESCEAEGYVLAMLKVICTEVVTNIIKYGDESKPVVIAAHRRGDPNTVVFTNFVGKNETFGGSNSGGRGMRAMKDAGSHAKIRVDSTGSGGVWTTTLMWMT